jgi:L-ascorbate metabolism protein UlaG (beta-lactamase superfamily)
MILTKYEHACFTLEKDGKLLVVDPGVLTRDISSPENVVAIVVTHEHADHFDPAALGALIAHSPSATIYAHESITNQLGDTLPTQSVAAGDTASVEPFELEFFGGEHSQIHSSIPIIANLGVMINSNIFYPGDSFTVPNKPVKTLALPITAPWLKISEVMDYVSKINPALAFPTHDGVASEAGKQIVDRMMGPLLESQGGTYQRLSEPLEIDG